MPTPKFANLQAILAEESEPETGVVSERAEERLESACKVIIGQRCKGAGMHWRYENALYVTALRARMRSAA